MRYLIELDSPDFHVLIEAAKREIVASAAVHHEMQRRWGRGHALAIAAGQREVAAARCLGALISANEAASPDRAVPSTGDTRPVMLEDDIPKPYNARIRYVTPSSTARKMR